MYVIYHKSYFQQFLGYMNPTQPRRPYENSILKYKWILRSLKHAQVFEHDGAAGVLEIEQVF
ncbi:hypothetical protein NQ317_001888 [Molorchus minor]|uniref:Uncharacterized protein n=1 Tax=Molorchus minor TaxID=1323400 RepID=A0ABQ9JF96_9CUCU|nr:hypothetical protein NQ317_001888 [Molorchus minor]